MQVCNLSYLRREYLRGVSNMKRRWFQWTEVPHGRQGIIGYGVAEMEGGVSVREWGVWDHRRVWVIGNGKVTVKIRVVVEAEYTKKMIEEPLSLVNGLRVSPRHWKNLLYVPWNKEI